MIAKEPKFTVVYGYTDEQRIMIDTDELEKIHYAKHLGAFFTGKYGDVDTTKIMAIRPDYKATYGSDTNYVLTIEDMQEITNKFGNIALRIGTAKNRVDYLLKNNKENLIGTGVDIPELDKQQSLPEAKQLANKMNVSNYKRPNNK